MIHEPPVSLERLLEPRRIKAGANRVRADDGDGLAFVARRRDEARGLTRGVDLGWVRVTHSNLLPRSIRRSNRLGGNPKFLVILAADGLNRIFRDEFFANAKALYVACA